MDIQNLFDCFVLMHEAATKYIETFVLEICPDEVSTNTSDKSMQCIDNYCEEDRRGTYTQYRDHLD